MFMKRLFIALVLSVASFFIHSKETQISKPLIDSFLKTSQSVSQVLVNYPELLNYDGDQGLTGGAAYIKFIQESSAAPQINSVFKESDFSSLTELFEFSERLMGLRIFIQLKSSKQASIFQTVKILKANLETMKMNNASENIIVQAEAVLEGQVKKAAAIQKALDKVTDDDKLFIEQNLEWITNRLSY